MSIGTSFFVPVSKGVRVGLFLLMPFNKCIGVIPCLGLPWRDLSGAFYVNCNKAVV